MLHLPIRNNSPTLCPTQRGHVAPILLSLLDFAAARKTGRMMLARMILAVLLLASAAGGAAAQRAESAQPAVAKLNDAIRKSLDDADVKTSLTIQGFEAEPDTPEALRDRIAADIGKSPTVVAKAGIQPE